MKTRDRIIHVSLELFNREGEPNVTTVDIANELDISPGNLYYHFKGKEELVRELFERFYEQFNVILRAPVQNPLRMEDNWFYLVVVFEHMHAYRFLYGNISLILQRYEQIQRPFRRLIHMKQDAARAICLQLRKAGIMEIDDGSVDMLARSIALTITYWFNFDRLLGDRPGQDEDLIHDGVLQVLSLIAPHLGTMQQEFMDTAHAIHSRLGRAAAQATRPRGGKR
ncbi:MAG: TetR/AcrR family transcriptional regulator [Pseudomonadales bacterium]|jgi:AcrR family transcriptional regulator|nr:TetR/AcrR family transcriptional regulator [Pseudomonadales bacterium]MBP9032249.1 TetR/AcrR family transcriptional regulator [Pseudomonadales bacterium]